jgi:hypothetical protein
MGVSAHTIIFTSFYYFYNLRVYHDDVGAPGPKSGLGIVSSGFGRAGRDQGEIKMFGGLVPTPLGSPEVSVASP